MAHWRKWTPPAMSEEELVARHSWGGVMAPHAIAVYFGLEDGHEERPWVDYVIDNADHQGMLQDAVVTLDIEQTFVNYAYSLGFEFQEAIEADIWEWPRTTIRSTGEVAGLRRNAVDTGALRDSQDIEFFGL